MAKDTRLQVSHDICMDLQWKIEALEDVERAFVHVDYKERNYGTAELAAELAAERGRCGPRGRTGTCARARDGVHAL